MPLYDDQTCCLPGFIKIILAPRLDLQKLKIPPKFMSKYGEDLEDVVHLRVPNGAIWEVNLMREKGKVWLQKGWPEFVNFYSILDTYALIFSLEGNSVFHVIIMSSNASEIEYPLPHGLQLEPSSKRKNKEITKSSAHELKRVKVEESLQQKVIGSKWQFTKGELEKINEYPTEEPCFVVKLTPSQLRPKFNGVNIPLEFARKYLHHQLGMFILEDKTHKKWPVRINIGNKYVKFMTKEWKNFAVENRLQAGNICIFKLVKDNKRRFKVDMLQTEDQPSGNKAQPKLDIGNY